MLNTGKKRLWAVPAAVVSMTVLAGIVMVYQGMQNKKEAEAAARAYSMEMPVETEVNAITVPPGTVSWKGKFYTYNERLSNFLFLGIDKKELVDTSVGYMDAGQSDAVFLLSWDRVENRMVLISIPRDTMTSYEIYSRDGKSMGKVTDHLSLAYAYGDGKHESGRFSSDAVSNLFYGIPIQGYCAVSMGALPVLIQELEGLTVVLPNDSLAARYPDCREGTSLVLDAENIEPYLRYRDITVSQSALMRLERQEVFLKACMELAESRFREDAGVVPRLYSSLTPYMVTNIGTDQFAKMMESMMEEAEVLYWTLPGEGRAGADFDEYHVDEDLLYEKIMETFYVEAE